MNATKSINCHDHVLIFDTIKMAPTNSRKVNQYAKAMTPVMAAYKCVNKKTVSSFLLVFVDCVMQTEPFLPLPPCVLQTFYDLAPGIFAFHQCRDADIFNELF